MFLRHALPGETGTAVVTGVRSGGRLIFADLVEVATPSSDRVAPPCMFSGPGMCGGCDFQHVAVPAQRDLKAAVIADCLRRIARLDLPEVPWDGTVHRVPGDERGLRWRTRSRFAVSRRSLAMQVHASRSIVPIDDCLIADTEVVAAARAAARRGGGAEIIAVHSSTGEVKAGQARDLSRETVAERAGGTVLSVAAAGFWQVHPGAPDVLAQAVAAALQPEAGDVLLDLYSGVGLFAATLAPQLPGGTIHAVEGGARASQLAAANLSGIAGAQAHTSAVLPWLSRYRGRADIVVLDPPRSGARAEILSEIDRIGPRAVAYVACDPAALARDLRLAVAMGWELTGLTAFDMFPMTHHIECVAGLRLPRR